MTTQTTRDSLIDIGRELMHRHGYNATGLSDILKAADVPKGSFYHHFSSKADFAAAALERYAAGEAAHAASVLGDARTRPLRRLRRYFEDLIEIYGQKGPIPGCMIARFSLEIGAEDAQLRKLVSGSFKRWQHTIGTVIGQAVLQNELPADTDSELLAGFLLNSWEGALLRSQAEASDAPLHAFMHYVFHNFLARQPKP